MPFYLANQTDLIVTPIQPTGLDFTNTSGDDNTSALRVHGSLAQSSITKVWGRDSV